MADFRGNVVVIVNTASKCGFTPQYAGLEELHRKYSGKGLVICGFPCNQFGNQEPGDSKEISEGCLINYGVSRISGREDKMEFYQVCGRSQRTPG